jgi:hypothetical protein
MNSVNENLALFLGAMTRKTIAHIRPLEMLKKAPNICKPGRRRGIRLETAGAIRKPVYINQVMYG